MSKATAASYVCTEFITFCLCLAQMADAPCLLKQDEYASVYMKISSSIILLSIQGRKQTLTLC